MLDLSSRAKSLLQGTADILNGLPWWAALLALFIPTLLALLTRQRWIVAAVGLLNAASVVLLLPSVQSLAGVIILFAASLVVALFGYQERQHVRWQAALQEQVEQTTRQTTVFLEALDRRTLEFERMRDANLKAPTPALGQPAGVPITAQQTSSRNPAPPQRT